MLINIIQVAIGSALGGVSRYLLSGWIAGFNTSLFPWGTFCVNLLGCFLLGIITSLFSCSYLTISHKLLFAIGFCGSFTTFSTFSLENLELFTSKAVLLGALNIGLSVIGGLFFMWLGIELAGKFISKI